MTTWELDGPDKLAFDQVDRVVVRVVEGAADVVGTDDQATLELSELSGEPLQVRQEGGTLAIDYKHPRRFGPLAWLTGQARRCRAVLSLAVPRDCRAELRAVSASLMVGGLHAPVQAKTVSGEVTWPGCVAGSSRWRSISARRAETHRWREPGREGSRAAQPPAGGGSPGWEGSRDAGKVLAGFHSP
jgi:hypothetical protein